MSLTKIAVVMTCHNRKTETLSCLNKLMNQQETTGTTLQIYLVDDGCTDGTGTAVKKLFPEIIVLRGEGNLFWCGGMRLAFGEALKNNFDYYLWLNDDTMLYPKAIRTLLDTAHFVRDETGRNAIIVGSLQDAESGKRTYGGLKRQNLWRPMALSPVEPLPDKPIPCDVMNGNCVLIPRNIATVLGNLSAEFKHAAADFDYSIRAGEDGFTCWVPPGYLGSCSRIYFKNLHRDNTLSIRSRISKLSSPAAILRFSDTKLLVRRHGGIFWPILLLRVLALNFRQWLWLRIHSNFSPL